MKEVEYMHRKLKILGVYKKFIFNTNSMTCSKVTGCFIWDNTDEGEDFWRDIHNKVKNMPNIMYDKKIIGGEVI